MTVALVNETISGVVLQENPVVIAWITGAVIFCAGCIFAVILGLIIFNCFGSGARGRQV